MIFIFATSERFTKIGGYGHSNTAEIFFSIFKRGVIGTYHHMSEAHLGRYCREFDLRYNTRKLTDSERARVIVKGMEGKRLTYRRIDKLAASRRAASVASARNPSVFPLWTLSGSGPSSA
jgi:hypothetical protein